MTRCDAPWFPLMSVPRSCHVPEWLWCRTDTLSWPWDSNYKRQCPTGSAALLSVIWVAVTSWLCLTCLMHVIVREHIMRLLTQRLTSYLLRRKALSCMFTLLHGKFKLCGLSAGRGGVCILSLVCSVRCGRTVCWHVCVFVQPRFSSSTECIYRTTPSNPNHSKVACTDTQYASQSCFSVTV